jgi:THO complex subunit 2
LYDIFVPRDRYQAEIQNQKLILMKLDHDPTIGTREDTSAAVQRRKRERERCIWLMEKLEKELKDQEENLERTMNRLRAERDWWFIGSANRYDIIHHLIQYCIYPRCIFSANDAKFCAKFMSLMHSLGTANFSSLTLYDRV